MVPVLWQQACRLALQKSGVEAEALLLPVHEETMMASQVVVITAKSLREALPRQPVEPITQRYL
jgi:hypothetical protein